MAIAEFTVLGHPEPGGSKTSLPVPMRNWKPGMPPIKRYLHDGDGRPITNTTDANPRVKAWRKEVARQVAEQYDGPLLDGPLIVEVTFYVHRFKSHYGTGNNSRLLKPSAPMYPASAPDVLKLTRAVEDALTGVVWTDDGRTVDMVLRERYCDGYILKDMKDKGAEGERVEIRVIEHRYATVGEAAEAAQGSLLEEVA